MEASLNGIAALREGLVSPFRTMADERLNQLTAMLLRLTDAEVGGISILHRDQVWRPAYIGPFEQVVANSSCFCTSALASCADWFEIEDAAADDRFQAHPLVTGRPQYRHYAAVPILPDCIQLQATLWAMWHTPGRLPSEQRESWKALAGLAAETLGLRYCDEVTRIVNRTFFIHSLQGLIEEGSQALIVGYINLCGFSRLNSIYGQHVGDEVLTLFGRRLVAWGGPGSLVAHLGGDRFAFSIIATTDGCAEHLRQLPQIIEQQLELASGQIHLIRARIGLRKLAASSKLHAAVVLQEAATAAAESAHGIVRSFDDGLRAQSRLAANLHELLAGNDGHGKLEVAYEPQFELVSGRLVGLEALVRWRHPSIGLLLPAHFIALAERMEYISRLDMLVLRQVCSDLRTWHQAGLPVVPVALNFSRASLVAAAMPTVFAEELARHGLEGRQFECEITESQCGRTDLLCERLGGLRRLGVRIAIDDFGAGYSNLDTLRQLPFDKLKIDRQFVAGVADDARLAGLVKMAVNIASLFDAEVLCEGVERERDLLWLRAHGVTHFQGWYFSMPLPPASVAKALSSLATQDVSLRHDELRAQLCVLRYASTAELTPAPGS